jgi:hypothetical protein
MLYYISQDLQKFFFQYNKIIVELGDIVSANALAASSINSASSGPCRQLSWF